MISKILAIGFVWMGNLGHRVWGCLCGWGASDDLLLQLTHAFRPHVQMYWPMNFIYYKYNPTTSCTTCALCTSHVPHLYHMYYKLMHLQPSILLSRVCDVTPMPLSSRNSTCISTTLELPSSFAAHSQVQPHVSCGSWIVQVLLELVILVWCAHVV